MNKKCIASDKGGLTLRFGGIVGGLASGLHPLLGFDQSPCLDTGGIRDASTQKPDIRPREDAHLVSGL